MPIATPSLSATPTRTPNPTNTSTPTLPAAPTVTDTPLPTVTDTQTTTPTPSPTATVTNTPLLTNIPTPSATEILLLTATPTGTSLPTATATSTKIAIPPTTPEQTVAPTTLSAPKSLRIQNGSPKGSEATVGELTTFVWQWKGQLPEKATFEVRIWEGDHHYGAYDVRSMFDKILDDGNGTYQIDFDVGKAYEVSSSSAGVFWWTVAVVQIEPYKSISPEAEPHLVKIKR